MPQTIQSTAPIFRRRAPRAWTPAGWALPDSTLPDSALLDFTLSNFPPLHAVAPGIRGRLKTGPSLPAHTATRGHIAPMPRPAMGAI
jgi:hypothetical protein